MIKFIHNINQSIKFYHVFQHQISFSISLSLPQSHRFVSLPKGIRAESEKNKTKSNIFSTSIAEKLDDTC